MCTHIQSCPQISDHFLSIASITGALFERSEFADVIEYRRRRKMV